VRSLPDVHCGTKVTAALERGRSVTSCIYDPEKAHRQASDAMHEVLASFARDAVNRHVVENYEIGKEVTPEDGLIKLERWPEGYVLWYHGEIAWKSWEADRPGVPSRLQMVLDAAERVRGVLGELPPGFTVCVDPKSDGIVVGNGILAFGITRTQIEDGLECVRAVAAYQMLLERLAVKFGELAKEFWARRQAV
jgi:hypothetical protein